MWLQVYSIVERRMSNVGFQEGRSGGGGGGVGGVGGVGGHGGAPPPSREYVTHCSLGTVLLQPSLCVIQRTGVPAWVLQSERTLKEWQRGSALQLLLPCATQSAVVLCKSPLRAQPRCNRNAWSTCTSKRMCTYPAYVCRPPVPRDSCPPSRARLKPPGGGGGWPTQACGCVVR